MKRSRLRKIGKIGEANIEARQKIAAIAEEKGINYCELQIVDDCTRSWPLAPCHRHERNWYQGDVQKLSDFNQWVSGCSNCHLFLDQKPIFREEMFVMLRGKE